MVPAIISSYSTGLSVKNPFFRVYIANILLLATLAYSNTIYGFNQNSFVDNKIISSDSITETININKYEAYSFTRDNLTGDIDLSDYLYLYKTNSGSQNIQFNLLNEIPFYKYHLDSLNCAYCKYTAKITLINKSDEELSDCILYLGKASYIDIYIYNSSGELISTQKSGRLRPSDLKSLPNGNRFERCVLNFKKNEQLYVVFQFYNRIGYKPSIKPILSPYDYLVKSEFRHQRIYDGIFIGFLVAILLFNVIFYITTRDQAFLYQALFVLSVFVFMSDIMGYMCDWPFMRNHPVLLEPVNFTSLIVMNISYLLFVNTFIQLKKTLPEWVQKIQRLIYFNILFGSIITIYYAISLNEWISDISIALVCAFQYLILLILLVQLSRQKNKKIYFILIATLFLIAGVLINGVSVTVGWGVFVDFSKFIVLANVSFFFLGLAYRMKILNLEELETIRLKENQELKNKLYANITHEFRTPLTVILGMARTIESSGNNVISARITEAVTLIKSNSKKLLDLVNTLLDLAKLESGKMNLILESGDIINYLRYCFNSFERFAESKSLHLQFLTELKSLEMLFDKDKIQQIISNLVSNAIKFTPKGGQIHLSANLIIKKDLKYLRIELSDTGQGIPDHEIPNLFNRFFQLTESGKYSEGSGLGLALVKELVTLMNGAITVNSQIGKGSSFCITLPVQSSNDSGVSNDSRQTVESLDSDHELNYSETSDSHLNYVYKEANSSEVMNLEKPLVLIVEDNKDIIYYLRTILEKKYHLEIAYNGSDGVELALEIIPDIIISDILMQGKTGLELCEQLKHDEKTNHIPIILLTAKVDYESRIEGFKKGADVYLTKPFNESELHILIENLLLGRKALQLHYHQAQNNELKKSADLTDPFLQKLNLLIHDNMEDEDFGILHLCRGMQMSRTQLHRKITALTGKSTSIYLRYLRLQKAKELLRTTRLNISEIAFAVGFSDPNYFTRSFTEEFGINPSAYRTSA